jgi:hypothetical protein
MKHDWIKALLVTFLGIMLVACPTKDSDKITGINATASPTNINSSANSSLSATVTGTGVFNSGVNWSIVSGGGSLSSNTGATVTYTAPSVTTATTVQVKATAAGDSNVSQTLNLSIAPVKPAIIPEHTKITDPATRDALSAYDTTTGTMRFSQSTPVLANLKADDVLVSAPSSLAPHGYLRKVVSVRTEGTEIVLETTQGNLTDAISQGTLAASGNLSPSQVKSTKLFFKGISIGEGGARAHPRIGEGQNYGFKLNFNQVFIPLTDPDNDVKGQITVDGAIEYNAGYGINLNISLEPCLKPPFVCGGLDSFETKIGFDQQASLHITGDLQGQLGKEIKIGEQYFDDIYFFIGPVLIVIVPHVDIFLSVSGQVTASFEFKASQNAIAQLGARWTPDDGWKNISDFDFSGTAPTPTFTGTLKPRAGVRSSMSFLLYGLTGPEASLTAGLEIDAQIPRNPIWILNGFLKGTLGFVVALPIVGNLAEYKTTLFDKSLEFLRSGNTAPKLELTANALPDPNVFPKGTPRTVPLGVPVKFENGCGIIAGFYFNAVDLEDGCSLGVTVVSSVDGTLPKTYTFQKEGLRTITVTARDSQGSSVAKSFSLNVINPPPVITLYNDGEASQGEAYSVAAIITDPNELDPNRLCANTTWAVDAPDSLLKTTGCLQTITFNTTGTREVRVSTTDSNGARVNQSLKLNVLPPLVNPYPRITSVSLNSQEIKNSGGADFCVVKGVENNTTIDLADKGCIPDVSGALPWRYSAGAAIENPTGEPLTYEWTLYYTKQIDGVIHISLVSFNPTFEISGLIPNIPQNDIDSCRVTLKVSALNPPRTRSKDVWVGTCKHVKIPAPN